MTANGSDVVRSDMHPCTPGVHRTYQSYLPQVCPVEIAHRLATPNPCPIPLRRFPEDGCAHDDEEGTTVDPDFRYTILATCSVIGRAVVCHTLTGDMQALPSESQWVVGQDKEGMAFVQPVLLEGSSPEGEEESASLWVSDLLPRAVYSDKKGRMFIGEDVKLSDSSDVVMTLTPMDDFARDWSPRQVEWSPDGLDCKISLRVAVVASHLSGMRALWCLQDVRQMCNLSADAGSGPPTKWIHKNLPQWKKHLTSAGLPAPVGSLPDAKNGAELHQGWALEWLSVCTPVGLRMCLPPFGAIRQPCVSDSRLALSVMPS